MYLWRCVFAVLLGLIWYFSDFLYVLVQAGSCALCLLMFFRLGGDSKACESGTQTDCATHEAMTPQKTETGHIVRKDEPDAEVQTVQKTSHQSQYPNIQRSVQHMFNCAYTHLVLPWSTAPQSGDTQQLHTALLTEFNFVMDEIICKAKDVDLPVTALGCIQIFTQHLQNAKQSDGSPAFRSKAEEIAAIKGFCKALIHNLLPKHLWEPNVYYCALQEILVVKALELVTLLSDPDNLNHLIISQLDQTPSEKPMEEVAYPERGSPSSNCSKNSDVLQDEVEEHPSKEEVKKKGNKMKHKISKIFHRMNKKKTKSKRKGKEVVEVADPCRKPAALMSDGTSSNECSISDTVETDVVSLTSLLQEERMEFKLSYEMWRFGNWAVTVTNVQLEGNELCFTIHLEEINNRENLNWDVKKNQSDIIQFYYQCKKIGNNLPSLLTLVEKPKTEWNMEEAREILEHSLQDLVNNAELSDSELVFKFLGPIDWIQHEEEHDGWVWDLLGGIASFLTPGQDDDELSTYKGDEKEHEDIYGCNTLTPEPELDATQPMSTDVLDRQDKKNEDGSLEADGGHLPTPEQSSTYTNEKQPTDYITDLFDQLETNPALSVNVAHYATKMKYVKFDHNFKRHAAALSESNEDSSSSCTNDAVSIYSDDGNISKEENLPDRKSSETDKPERKEKEEETLSQPSGEKKTSNSLEKPEANKVIFDLLKEISGNSYTFKFMKAVVKPFTPLINKKVNVFLKKMNPSEAQIATYIDSLCENIWPDRVVPQPLPESSDHKNETKQKAMQIITSKFEGLAIINKASVESIFKIFQNAEENKKLVYVLLMYLLREFLPGELCFE